MYFVQEDVNIRDPLGLLDVRVRNQIYGIDPEMPIANLSRYAFQGVPTHTEDGIPIRKLYVSNLPPKTTRKELLSVFVQYGYVKSCWLRVSESAPGVPAYGFVTFKNPSDAYKALISPNHERILRGNALRISPADSWHQPAEDAGGNVEWRPARHPQPEALPAEPVNAEQSTSSDVGTCENNQENTQDASKLPSEEADEESEEQPDYTVLNILNRDCWEQILSYIPVTDLIRSERVSKQWQMMIREYLLGIRLFRTSCWQHNNKMLTTAVLRCVLQRLGSSLTRLHIDHHWSALNDRTAHTVGKFCPYLEELKVVGMHTKNWNPLVYGCKQLKILSFLSCNKVTDKSLMQFVKKDSSLESLTITNNSQVTGLFLSEAEAQNLTSLCFSNLHSLQGTVLSATLQRLPSLKVLKLDVGSVNLWKIVPEIIKKLPNLEELSLSEYMSNEVTLKPNDDEAFCDVFKTIPELRVLNVSRNIYVTNGVLKNVAQFCPKLENLNVSSCNSRKKQVAGVGDEGLIAICRGCPELCHIDVSYLAGLTDAGVSTLASCHRLQSIITRGNSVITSASLAKCVRACHLLEEVDACGCDMVSDELVGEAVEALEARPRSLTLRLAATPTAHDDVAAELQEGRSHRLLVVDVKNDRSDAHLRPDFVDRMFEDNSDNSFDDIYDLYDVDEFHDFFSSDDDNLLNDNDDDDDYEDAMYHWQLQMPDVLII